MLATWMQVFIVIFFSAESVNGQFVPIVTTTQAVQCASKPPVDKDLIGPALRCGIQCRTVELTGADACRFDISDCGDQVYAGTSCKVACKAPYSGEPTFASCPPGNSKSTNPAFWTRPDCDLNNSAASCSLPQVIPEAYVRDDDGKWTCAPGYAGKAYARCVPNEGCVASTQLFGCAKKTVCAPPDDLIGCIYDVTGCADVKPGGACPIGCRFPYTGWPSTALCRPDNTNSESGLLVVEPQCTLTCEDPPAEPDGYIRDSSTPTGWGCAPGFGGTVIATCVIDSVCTSKKVLKGCEPQASCILPQIGEDSCAYDFTDCIGENARPGGVCMVHCQSPYEGNSTNATCPAGNTDPLRELQWVKKPLCKLNCDKVANVLVGYVSHPYRRVYGGWECVENYAGTPVATCGTDKHCQPLLKFSGCNALVNCMEPQLTRGEQCTFDARCSSVRSGRSCDVTCKPPYVGGVAKAYCPANNTQQNRKLIWAVPDCNLECAVPDPLPNGYVNLGIDPILLKPVWKCAPKYEGSPIVKCKIGDDCRSKYEFSGCIPQTTCAIPKDVPCSIDWSNCGDVFAGETCDVICGKSFVGNTTMGSCPEGNTDRFRPLEWSFPGCSLICLDPPPPPGYQKLNWMCDTNYSGIPDTKCRSFPEDTCTVTYDFAGCKPLVPCAPPRLGRGKGARPGVSGSDLDKLCMFDFSECQSVDPGQSCTVRCGNGYNGSATTAYCPSDNTDPQGELLFVEPLCKRIECELPSQTVKGYTYERGCGWSCAASYKGSANAVCELRTWRPSFASDEAADDDGVGENSSDSDSLKSKRLGSSQSNKLVQVQPGKCEPVLAFSGCMEFAPCAPMVANDTCRFNVSLCQRLLPGQSCNITCAKPYTTTGQGENVTTAFCPSDNADPFHPPVLTHELGEWAVDCELECPEPEEEPLGYLKVDGAWVCNETGLYAGQASATCGINTTTCEPEISFSGCKPTRPCVMPELGKCEYDLSGCPADGKLLPGTSCTVVCKSPYMTPVNEPSGLLSCPDQNIDPLAIQWSKPRCILGCARATSQTGYTNYRGTWECTGGYEAIGAIWEQCVVDPLSCIVYPRLFGCSTQTPCIAPTLVGLQKCMIDATSCTSVDPGQTCTVRCQAGFEPVGVLGVPAACPRDNTDKNRVVNWAPPNCQCPVIWNPPTGYERFSRTYSCAAGYLGTARYSCIIVEETCSVTTSLSGCLPILNCAAPKLVGQDICKYDAHKCNGGLLPGESCNITCFDIPGLKENVTDVYCPADNVIPGYSQQFELDCGEFQCEPAKQWAAKVQPDAGYVPGQWECAPGYRGAATELCTEADGCGGKLVLGGCVPLQNCIAPKLAGGPRDTCRLNFTECESLEPGQFCEVSCAAPFYGSPGKAFCRPDNIDHHQEFIYAEPDCHLDCAMPDPIPPGYVKTDTCGWQCAAGYDGFPQADCIVNDDCQPHLVLTGCTREENCVPPPPRSYDQCRFNFSDCFNRAIPPGTSCTAKCKAPYLGPDFAASCPAGNTMPAGDLVYDGSSCSLPCDDPNPLPAGYVKDGQEWKCAGGYLGTPYMTCNLRPNCGLPESALFGCEKIVPCATPRFEDHCKYEAFGCSGVLPGSACQIGCKRPAYIGNRTAATCPSPNTDFNRPLEWKRPGCKLDCPEIVLPDGYVLEADGRFACSQAAIGEAVADCQVDDTCNTFWNFTGCDLLRNCTIPSDIDRCRVDVSRCSELGPGESCNITCAPDYVGVELNATCPDNNIDPAQPIVLSAMPDCKCPVPPAPKGYASRSMLEETELPMDGGIWECAKDYTGTAIATCEINRETCKQRVDLSGCLPIHHCAPPDIKYMGDRKECQMIPSGEDCEAKCLRHDCISGGPLTFRCPALNTDPKLKPTLIDGTCKVRCELCQTNVLVDTNPQPGVISGTLRFGEAHASGRMPVSEIQGYRVFWTDRCGKDLGDIAYEKQQRNPNTCCATGSYKVNIENVLMPGDEDQLQLMIGIVTNYGELEHPTRVTFSDSTRNITVTEPPKRIITSSSRRWRAHNRGHMLILGCVAALLMQSFRLEH